MHDKTEQQLQQDALKLQQLAVSRLNDKQFSTQIHDQLEQALSDQKTGNQPRRGRSTWLAVAAGVALTAMAWLFLQPPTNMPAVTPMGPVVAVEKRLQLDLMQWPRAVESQVNQPLLDEQQAIIADFKNLKSRMLSI